MANLDELRAVFRDSLGLAEEIHVDGLVYQSIQQWDSIAHMNLISAMEHEFNVMLDKSDIISMRSFRRAIHILQKNGVTI